MEKLMRNAPTVAVLVVMVIQISRVSEFGGRVGAGLLAPVFAVFLAGTIYVLSYWQARTKYEVTADKETEKAKHSQQMRMKRLHDSVNRTSSIWLALFVIIEGYLNLSETMANLPRGVTGWVFTGALMYGAFPTLAAFGLGSLQAQIDRIPNGVANKSLVQALYENAMRRIETQSVAQPAQAAQDANNTAQENASASQSANNAAYPVACPHGCGAQLQNAQQYSAHVGRWCEVVKARNAQNASSDAIPVEIPVITGEQ